MENIMESDVSYIYSTPVAGSELSESGMPTEMTTASNVIAVIESSTDGGDNRILGFYVDCSKEEYAQNLYDMSDDMFGGEPVINKKRYGTQVFLACQETLTQALQNLWCSCFGVLFDIP